MAGRPRSDRRAAREAVMRLLFEAAIRNGDPLDLYAERQDELGLAADTRAYAETLIHEIAAQCHDLDATISELAPAWPIAQMAQLEVALLRIGITEIDSGRVPPAVAINEAVELAKQYCTEGGRRLVNGALGTHVRRRADSPAL